MYGDTGVMRKRVAQLREQADDLRAVADQLVARTEAIAWSGRAADAIRERIRERAAHLRDVAGRHDLGADSLERHLTEVETLKEQIAATERRTDTLVADARARIAHAESYADVRDVRLEATPEDRELAALTTPPPGHKDWLALDLPGLR